MQHCRPVHNLKELQALAAACEEDPTTVQAQGLRHSGGRKGGHLKGRRLKMGFRAALCTRHVDFTLKFALNTPILTALPKAIPQGKRRLEKKVPSRQRKRHLDGTMR